MYGAETLSGALLAHVLFDLRKQIFWRITLANACVPLPRWGIRPRRFRDFKLNQLVQPGKLRHVGWGGSRQSPADTTSGNSRERRKKMTVSSENGTVRPPVLKSGSTACLSAGTVSDDRPDCIWRMVASVPVSALRRCRRRTHGGQPLVVELLPLTRRLHLR